MEIVQLTASDYDEWLCLLNEVFGRVNGKPMDFERELPRMCVRDEEHMRMHIGVREQGKLRAVVGIYPLPARICGIPVLFSTVGNVATHWEWEGRGYMSRLLSCAMERLDAIGADASRLSGYRQRYNRYGYENCGTVYHLTMTDSNRLALSPAPSDRLTFLQIERDDRQSLAFAESLYRRGGIAVVRDAAPDFLDMYTSLTAWRHIPWLAVQGDGTPVGYLSVSQEGESIAEAGARDTDALCDILCQWQERVNRPVRLQLAPWQPEALRRLGAVCEEMTAEAPCLFRIRNWVGITDALMKLKASHAQLPEGELVLEIRDYGNIRLYARGGEAGCEATKQSAAIRLDRLTAARFLFGPAPADCVADCRADGTAGGMAGSVADRLTDSYGATPAGWIAAVLPLPLSWNLQDRV